VRVFVTGASGFIGSATVAELVGSGHDVVGLARSGDSAKAIEAAGARVIRGSLEDLNSLRAGADSSEGVIHLAYVHDFPNFEGPAKIDLCAIETIGQALEGSGRPFLIASGVLALRTGAPATEEDPPDPNFPRSASAIATVALAGRGVRSGVVRLPPTVHGRGDKGFVPMLIDIARTKGVSAYVGDGSSRWPAVHRVDAAVLFRLGLENAPPGSVLHAVADEGVPARTIAEVIGRQLDLPVVSIPESEAAEHFGWLAMIFAADLPASSDLTRKLLGWEPGQAGLIEDMEEGHYFH
jgi:nucleoside-diphosphate-sugar epimerase